jgi:prenyltransferase/squalene oxidase-like repeat protein
MAVEIASRAPDYDWRRTIVYIDQNGSEVERARLRGLLGRARPDVKVIRTLEARQNDDGGFPYGMVPGRLSTLEATTTALEWMQDLGVLASPPAERALFYLLSVQRPDGAWDEPVGLMRYGPPPHLLPGDPRVRALSTALVAYWLATTGRRDDHAVARAVGYLRTRQTPEGRFAGFLQTTWLATAVFLMVDGNASEAAALGLEALAAVELTRWYPGSLTGMLTALGEAGVPKTALLHRGLARLIALSQPDGSWVSEEGDLYHVDVTLRALRALILHGATSLRGGAEVPAVARGATSS